MQGLRRAAVAAMATGSLMVGVVGMLAVGAAIGAAAGTVAAVLLNGLTGEDAVYELIPVAAVVGGLVLLTRHILAGGFNTPED